MRDALGHVNERLSVGAKIGLLLLVMLLLAGVNVGAVYYYQGQVDTLSNSVDVAGQQRMLSQRMAYVAFMMAQGHDDGPIMNESIATFDRNLDAISEGGTVGNATLKPAPAALEDELATEREVWETYRAHARTVATERPYDPEYRRSLDYLTEHRAELLDRSDAVVTAYENQAGQTDYAAEINVAGRQRMLSQQITAIALEMSARTARPGTEAAEKIDMQEDDRMQELEANLTDRVADFDAALTALEEGGTYQGTDLDPAPPAVRTEIDAVRDAWAPYRANATALAEGDRLNPAFWESLAYLEGNSDHLRAVSDDVVGEFAAVSAARIGRLKGLLIGLLAIDVLVFLVGTVLARRFIGTPISRVAAVADDLARGSLDVDESVLAAEAAGGEAAASRRDEIAKLRTSVGGLHAYLTTVAAQAEALADQDFEASVLEESVPGEFGDALERMHRDLEELIGEMEAANEEAEAARAEAEALSASLERTAEEFGEEMAAAAEGDLTRRMDAETDNEAMAEIATAFNEMVDQLEGTIGSVQAFAGEVATASDAVTESAREVKAASDEVSRSVQEITDGSSDQSETLQQVSEEMNDLSATIEEVASSAESVAGTAATTADLGRDGQEAGEAALAEMERIQETTATTVETVTALDETVAEIGEIVDLIADVAEQTNLLALNANIEAARAGGDAGDGFDVVADEVKQLATETQESTAEIEALIADVQDQTAATVEEIEATESRVERGVETVGEAVEVFERIVENVEATDDGVGEISEATDDQATSTQQAVAMVDDVAAISEETTAEAETVAATAQQQAAALDEVVDDVEGLSARASELRDRVEAFAVGEAGTAAAEAPDAGPAAADGGDPAR